MSIPAVDFPDGSKMWTEGEINDNPQDILQFPRRTHFVEIPRGKVARHNWAYLLYSTPEYAVPGDVVSHDLEFCNGERLHIPRLVVLETQLGEEFQLVRSLMKVMVDDGRLWASRA